MRIGYATIFSICLANHIKLSCCDPGIFPLYAESQVLMSWQQWHTRAEGREGVGVRALRVRRKGTIRMRLLVWWQWERERVRAKAMVKIRAESVDAECGCQIFYTETRTHARTHTHTQTHTHTHTNTHTN